MWGDLQTPTRLQLVSVRKSKCHQVIEHASNLIRVIGAQSRDIIAIHAAIFPSLLTSRNFQ